MGSVDRRPVVCPTLAMGFWVPLHYDQELLASMFVLSSQSRLLGSNPIVWLCDQEPVKSFQKGPKPEKAKLKRWWTYLGQFRLTVPPG